MSRLRPAGLGHGRHGDASLQTAADGMVLGSTSHDNPFQRYVGASIGGPAGCHLQDRLAADAKIAGSMVDPNRAPLEGVVEVDQAEIPFRAGDAFFEPGNAGKILVIGAVEVIDRGTNQAKPRRKHAKYLDTRSGRLRLAVIADNSAASIE